jgi:hypothetical protein
MNDTVEQMLSLELPRNDGDDDDDDDLVVRAINAEDLLHLL